MLAVCEEAVIGPHQGAHVAVPNSYFPGRHRHGPSNQPPPKPLAGTCTIPLAPVNARPPTLPSRAPERGATRQAVTTTFSSMAA